MKLQHILFTFLLTAIATLSFAQDSYEGLWKTVDDETGEAKSHLEIFVEDGLLYGKVIEILNPEKKGSVCEKCSGSKKDQPVEGMILLEGLKKKNDYYTGGTITDPENGKEYKCYIELKGEDKLKVRGYIGVAALGRTQYWYRIK